MGDVQPPVGSIGSFDLLFPLPYRVATLIVAGVWAWSSNLYTLHSINIDVPELIDYPPRHSKYQAAHHLTTYRLASSLTIPLLSSWVLWLLVTRGDTNLIHRWDLIPYVTLLLLLVIFFLPVQKMAKNGRARFGEALARLTFSSASGIAKNGEGKFGDILLGDALCSYARVLADVFVAMCMLFEEHQITVQPDRACGGKYIVPFLIAIPSWIRIRQCLTEWTRTKESKHLANTAKYFSTIPVIALGASRSREIYPYWVFFAAINALYSYYWDIMMDWDLTLFSPATFCRDPPGLRPRRYFPDRVYYFLIVLDFALRCTWAIQLTVYADSFSKFEGGVFCLQLLEIMRRWLWDFLRIEAEWIRVTGSDGLPRSLSRSSSASHDLLISPTNREP